MQVAPVYGYEITRPIFLPDAELRPLRAQLCNLEDFVADELTHHLTGLVLGSELPSDMLFRLEAVLCFIQRMSVIVGQPRDEASVSAQPFPDAITLGKRHPGGGDTLPSDFFYPDVRGQFVRLAMAKLSDSSYCERTGFDRLFFKYVEAHRQRRPFIEVTWFLLMSGLEGFARKAFNDEDAAAQDVIYKLLRSYGFEVFLDMRGGVERCVLTYTKLRNRLFHNGERTAKLSFMGVKHEVDMPNYHCQLTRLVGLVILKALGFESEHINWDSWIDRQAFC